MVRGEKGDKGREESGSRRGMKDAMERWRTWEGEEKGLGNKRVEPMGGRCLVVIQEAGTMQHQRRTRSELPDGAVGLNCPSDTLE